MIESGFTIIVWGSKLSVCTRLHTHTYIYITEQKWVCSCTNKTKMVSVVTGHRVKARKTAPLIM